jgi:cytidine deaminase
VTKKKAAERRTVSATERRALLRHAAAARRNAYAPYSRYRVGAALLAADGRVFTGCNVENASYGLTLCAERVAVGSALAAGCRNVVAVAVVAGAGALPFPCGACRQVLAEFCGPDVPVFVAHATARSRSTALSLGRLLPMRFRLK